MKSLAFDVSDLLIREIQKYKDIVVTQANVIGDTPSYPYITVDVLDPYIPVTSVFNANIFNMRVQIKVVSNDKTEYSALLEFVRRLFEYKQPTSDLLANNVGVISIESNPSMENYIENEIIYDGGFDLVLNIEHKYEDFTQQSNVNKFNLDIGGK